MSQTAGGARSCRIGRENDKTRPASRPFETETDAEMGRKALVPLASLSGFTGGSGGLGVATAGLGMTASVLPTTTRAVDLPGRCGGKSNQGCVVAIALFISSDAGFAGGFVALAVDQRSEAEGPCEAISAPSGWPNPLREGPGLVVSADAWEAMPPSTA